MKRFLLLFMSILFVGVLAACGGDAKDEETTDSSATEEEATEVEDKDYTINIGVTPWTSTVPPTKIARILLEDMGYEVTETEADVTSIFIGLARGEIDAYMDSWLPVHEPHFEKHGDKIENLALSYDEARGGLVVPNYMEDINSIEDLIGQEDLFGNEILGIEPGGGAAQRIDEVIEGYELDMEQINSSEGAMMAEAQRLMEQEEPVVFYGWRPHTMFNKMDIKELEDPREVFPSSSIHVVVSSELKDNAPEAYEFLERWSMDMDELEEMIVKIDEGEDETEVAQEWIDSHEEEVNKMLGK